MVYPGARFRKQLQEQQQQGPLSVSIPVASVQQPSQPPAPSLPQHGSHYPAAPRPPPSYAPVVAAPSAFQNYQSSSPRPQPQQPIIATAYAVPVQNGAFSGPGAYGHGPPIPSAPPLPPPSAPLPPPWPSTQAPTNLYTPVGGFVANNAVATPPPSQQGRPSSSLSSFAPPSGYQPPPRPAPSFPPSSSAAYRPPHRPPSSSPSPLPEGSTYQRPNDLHGALPFSSPCNGRRKALFVGITYAGTRAELKGCVNDVKNLHAFIQRTYGFQPQEMRVLTDDPGFSEGTPTRQNIVQGMRWLVGGARHGDR